MLLKNYVNAVNEQLARFSDLTVEGVKAFKLKKAGTYTDFSVYFPMHIMYVVNVHTKWELYDRITQEYPAVTDKHIATLFRYCIEQKIGVKLDDL